MIPVGTHHASVPSQNAFLADFGKDQLTQFAGLRPDVLADPGIPSLTCRPIPWQNTGLLSEIT